jgi:hypothetical protein
MKMSKEVVSRIRRQVVFTSAHLREILDNMTPERRKAGLFAIITGMTEREVVSLTWKQLDVCNMNELELSIVQSIKPDRELENVFFEDVIPGYPAPLIGLGDSIWEAASGITLEQLQKMFQRMVFHDPEMELSVVRLAEPRFPVPFD